MDPSINHSGAQQLEGIPELIQNIQSQLPVKDAARTSVLSKSWRHAWSTIRTLRFHHIPTPILVSNRINVKHEINSLQLVDIDSTLQRYLNDNIPIEKFELIIEIENRKSARLAARWLLDLATKTRVKELSLRITLSERGPASFNLPLEILSIEHLTKLKVIVHSSDSVRMWSNRRPVNIKCVSLRKLHLDGLGISQNILDGILSSCRLLEKVKLSECTRYLNTIKVENLPCLYKLSIFPDPDEESIDFVISHLPNLDYFYCNSQQDIRPFNAHSISLGSRVTDLSLLGMGLDYTSLDIIKSGSPTIESLTLDMSSWMLGSFHYTSASIMSLSLYSCPRELINIQIDAPKLSDFQIFKSYVLPSLLFPSSGTLELLNLCLLKVDMHADASFFLKLRETLALSRKCRLHIQAYNYNKVPLSDMDMSDLRKRLMLPPARNLEWFSFGTENDECGWERSHFFDALFEICHPEEVYAYPDWSFHSNHVGRMMLKEVLEKKETGPTENYWPRDLEHVQIDLSPDDEITSSDDETWETLTNSSEDENWETLTNSHTRLLIGSTPDVHLHFKLKWR